jgi:hypothetical protein
MQLYTTCSLDEMRKNIKRDKNKLTRREKETGWDLAEWSERCASILTIIGLNPSGGSELTFCFDLLLTARGNST